eukprot:2374055-Amphidinium_carterae.1
MYGMALMYATEARKADREVVQAAAQQNGHALKLASEALRADREIVLIAVRKKGMALQHTTEALKADREVAQAAVQHDNGALQYAADCLLEERTFATEAKRQFYLLKLTMLSGRSTVVAASGYTNVGSVLDVCRERLGLADNGATLELCHGSNWVPVDGTE